MRNVVKNNVVINKDLLESTLCFMCLLGASRADTRARSVLLKMLDKGDADNVLAFLETDREEIRSASAGLISKFYSHYCPTNKQPIS